MDHPNFIVSSFMENSNGLKRVKNEVFSVFSGPASAIIGHLGGVHDLLLALKNHPTNAQLCGTCLNALWGLSVYGKSG